MKGCALDSSGICTSGKSRRESKRTVVDSAVRNRAIKVSADHYSGRHIELKAADADSVAVFVVAVDAAAHVQTREAEAITRPLPNSTRTTNTSTKQRQATAVKPKLEM